MFFLSDVLGTTLAVCIFALLFLIPGYVFGFLGNLFDFRCRDLNWRVIMSVPLSAAISPLAVYLLLLAHSPGFLRAVFALIQLLALAMALGYLGHERPRVWISWLRKIPPTAIVIALVWFLVSALSLADLQTGQRVYYSAVATDHEFRVAVTDAITRTGIPPASPFNHIDGDVPLRYHIFWFALCSVAERLGGGLLNARHALNASVVWCGFALICLVPLCLRVFEGLEGPALRRRALIGVGLLGVTGLDLIPNLLFYLRHEIPPADMEWWATDQVTSWADATLWVPHHVAAVVAGFSGFLLIWHAALRCTAWRSKLIHATMAGAAFASATGCSIYVGGALAATIASWTLFTLLRRWHNHAVLLVIAGVSSIVFELPNLLRLQQANSGGRFLVLSLWSPAYSEPVMRFLHLQSGLGAFAVQLLLLPLTYGIEFGFFLLAGVIKVYRLWISPNRNPKDAAGLVIAGTILVLCTFVRSATISNNDFGWRGFMLLQLVLLLWATELFDSARAKWLPAAYILLLIGCGGTIYQLAVLRFYNVAVDAGVFGATQPPGAEGRLTYSLRKLYFQLDTMLPLTAIVQVNPDTYIDYCWGLYCHRQTVSTGPDCMVAMGGNIDSCHAALPPLRQLFDAATVDPEQARAIARRFRLDAVVVRDTDAVWGNPASWIYQMHAAVETPGARAFLFAQY